MKHTYERIAMTLFNIIIGTLAFITAALAIAKLRYELGYSKYSPYYKEEKA
jgi:hypothetical protein